MNYIRHLNGFFQKAAEDTSLNPSHIGLYMALFQQWNSCRFINPVSISRSELMFISKLHAKGTYHKCLKDLHTLGYIVYEPSNNPFKGSKVYMVILDGEVNNANSSSSSQAKNCTSPEQVVDHRRPFTVLKIEQALTPYINNINSSNKENNTQQAASHFPEIENTRELETSISPDSTKSPIPGSGDVENQNTSVPPNLSCVKTYFTSLHQPPAEAEKFFNHYSSNGWRVGGRTPMVDWQASARNWINNSKNFTNDRHQRVRNPTTDLRGASSKNYSEPL